MTPSPSASTVPVPSWPRVSGSAYGKVSAGQLITAMSEWHTPAAATFSSTCPGPGSGSGTVTTSGAAPISRYWTAFMRLPFGSPIRNERWACRQRKDAPPVPPAPGRPPAVEHRRSTAACQHGPELRHPGERGPRVHALVRGWTGAIRSLRHGPPPSASRPTPRVGSRTHGSWGPRRRAHGFLRKRRNRGSTRVRPVGGARAIRPRRPAPPRARPRRWWANSTGWAGWRWVKPGAYVPRCRRARPTRES